MRELVTDSEFDSRRATEREVYERFAPRVRSLLRGKVHDREAIGELTNDVLYAVIIAMREGTIREPDALPGFVRGVARNLANNYLRRQAGHQREEHLDLDSIPAARCDGFEHLQQIESIRRVLERLKALDRTILSLVLMEGLTSEEIARRLSLSSEVVRARKARAIKRIIELLGAPESSE